MPVKCTLHLEVSEIMESLAARWNFEGPEWLIALPNVEFCFLAGCYGTLAITSTLHMGKLRHTGE